MSKKHKTIDFKTDKRTQIIKDILYDIIYQVSDMEDDELKEDRSDWIKAIRYTEEKDGLIYKPEEFDDKMKYNTSIYTLAIEIEQLHRWGEIYYEEMQNR
jgi:hypothetical protein